VTDRIDMTDDELPDDLRDAVELLRESGEPSAAWRAAVVRAATETSAPARPALRARGQVWWAAAAGLAGVLIGGSSMFLAMRAREPQMLAATPATAATQSVSVRFSLHAPGASAVTIVGDFNRWDPAAIPLRQSADGTTWEVEIPLSPGRYAYAFYVDGALARDPTAPQVRDDDFGTPNSVVMVRGT
jgi:hypothetical protein